MGVGFGYSRSTATSWNGPLKMHQGPTRGDARACSHNEYYLMRNRVNWRIERCRLKRLQRRLEILKTLGEAQDLPSQRRVGRAVAKLQDGFNIIEERLDELLQRLLVRIEKR